MKKSIQTICETGHHKKNRRWLRFIKKSTKILLLAIGLSLASLTVLWLLFPFPEERLNKWAISPSVLDIKGRPILAVVGSDDQWRQPVPLESISPWLIKATIAVEDERFYKHPGIDPFAALRAIGQNLKAGKVVSGASTLDMQVCRMIDDRPRTISAKLVESFRALQLNQLKSKNEILQLYLNIAPFGGNIRGAEMASLTYFAKHAKDLAPGEAALLAGLPKSPSRYRPDKYLDAAIKRRNTVLNSMLKKELINEQQFIDAQVSPIVINKSRIPLQAWHAAWMAISLRPKGGRTCIDLDIQNELERLVADNSHNLPDGSEAAVVIIDIATSGIIAMIGSSDPRDPVDGQVNGVLARRSPGSALKPFIYAAAFEMNRLNSESIVYDIPIQRGGWSPANFDEIFMGEVTVGEALRRSLNVPAILVAEQVGLARCCGILEAAGIRLGPNTQTKSGLSLAVGGVEVTLLDLTNAYATLGRAGIRENPHLFPDEQRNQIKALTPDVCSAINDILSSRNRRPGGMVQFQPGDVPWFMWKTGTSSGRRDALAIGHNGRYAVGLWVGRFRGTGRMAYVGAEAAEPLLARVFNLPRLRANYDPPPSASIVVRNPLSPPAEAGTALKITEPQNGDTFVSINGTTVIRPSINSQSDHMWFLNGKMIDNTAITRLVLTPGYYELHCMDKIGQSSTVCFAVR